MIQDAYADPRFSKLADEASGYRTTNILATAVKDFEGNTIGVLQAINKPSEFDTKDSQIISQLAAQAGVTLRNSALHVKAVRN
jgi:hypothetical protein